MGEEKFRFAPEIIEQARSLKAQGKPWSEVAELLRCKEHSLIQAIHKRRVGKTNGIGDVQDSEREYIESAAYAGMTPREIALEIAKARGVPFTKELKTTVHGRVNRMGFDSEEEAAKAIATEVERKGAAELLTALTGVYRKRQSEGKPIVMEPRKRA